MKKVIALVLCLVSLMFVLSSCKLKKEETEPEPEIVAPTDDGDTGVVNPMTEVDSPKTFQLGGFAITPPEGSTDIVCHYIDDYSIAQVKFTYQGHEYTYRASTSLTDISGVYGTFKTDVISLNVGEGEYASTIEIKTTDEDGRLCSWSLSPVTFSLFTPDKMTDDEIKAVVISITTLDLPKTAELLRQK